MFLCVWGIDFDSSTILIFDFEIVPTVCYLFRFILSQKSMRERSRKKVKSSTLAAQYRLNFTPTRTSDKILRPKKNDMVQVVKDEVELSGVFNDPKAEEKEVKEIRLLNLDDSDFSDDEEGKMRNLLETNKCLNIPKGQPEAVKRIL